MNDLCLGCFLESKLKDDHLCGGCLLDVWKKQKTFIDENEIREEWKIK